MHAGGADGWALAAYSKGRRLASSVETGDYAGISRSWVCLVLAASAKSSSVRGARRDDRRVRAWDRNGATTETHYGCRSHPLQSGSTLFAGLALASTQCL